jgi:pyroglutamyl-peptidase
LTASAPLRVLITAFGPFPGAPFNPTPAVAKRLVQLRRPGLSGTDRHLHVFRTSYGAVDAELPTLLAREQPDIVLMLGLAARTRHIRIETRARNARSVLLSDRDGRVPRAQIDCEGPSWLPGRAPFRRLLAATRSAPVPTRLSRDAGRYLCNYLYWQVLRQSKRPAMIAFVHVPQIRTSPTRRRGRVPPTGDDLAQACARILTALVAAAQSTTARTEQSAGLKTRRIDLPASSS